MSNQSAALANAPLTASRQELLRDGSDAAFRLLVHRLLGFGALLETIRSGFAEMIGLTGIQYTCLISVRHLQDDRGVGVKRLAEHLSLSGAFVTIETGKLVRQGLLSKRANPEDKRRVLLSVTEKGQGLLAELAPVQRDVNDALFASLSAADADRLSALMSDLLSDARQALALLDYLRGGRGAAADAG